MPFKNNIFGISAVIPNLKKKILVKMAKNHCGSMRPLIGPDLGTADY